MKSPLVSIDFPSIYFKDAKRLPLPTRMAQCTPDIKTAIAAASASLAAEGGTLFLSDLFRSHEMQKQAHADFVAKRKKAFSPPPGGSLHEAGRAFDLDLDAIKVPLARFWVLAAKAGLVPIIDKPISGVSESWHFECRGSHQLVYDYYKAGNASNFDSPYKAMAASAILSVGIEVDRFGGDQDAAFVQSALIRLGDEIGGIDGAIGPNTRKALTARGIDQTSLAATVAGVGAALKARFPTEF